MPTAYSEVLPVATAAASYSEVLAVATPAEAAYSEVLSLTTAAAAYGEVLSVRALPIGGGPGLRAGILATLRGHAPLAAIVGTRVRPGFIAQRDALPAVTFLVIADDDDDDLDGEDGTRTALVQLDCWAETLVVAERAHREAWLAMRAARRAWSLGGVPLRWLAPEGDADSVVHRGDGSDRAYARVRSEVAIRYHAPYDDDEPDGPDGEETP